MIAYAFSTQGKSHIERKIVCQDSSKTGKLKCGWYMGIVADGVGSAIHSDEGSKIAVRSLYDYCDKHIDKGISPAKIEKILEKGYAYAMEQTEQYVQSQNGNIAEYDTTLSSAIYDGQKLVYGHAGDGGIIARYTDGRIEPVTVRQKGADGVSVRPLRQGEGSWDFGCVDKKVASVLLVTDGILDELIQPVLLNLPKDRMALAKGNFKRNNVFVTACEFFMNPYAIYMNSRIRKPSVYLRKFISGNLSGDDQKSFLDCMKSAYKRLLGVRNAAEIGNNISKYYYAVWAMQKITDDKSVACLINEKAVIKPQPLSYYLEKDWKWRQECFDAFLYGKPLPKEPKEKPPVRKDDRKRDKSEEGEKEKFIEEDQEDENVHKKRWIGYLVGAVVGAATFIAATILVISFFMKEEEDHVLIPSSEEKQQEKEEQVEDSQSESEGSKDTFSDQKNTKAENVPKEQDNFEKGTREKEQVEKAAEKVVDTETGTGEATEEVVDTETGFGEGTEKARDTEPENDSYEK